MEIAENVNGFDFDRISILGNLTLFNQFNLNINPLFGLDLSRLEGEVFDFIHVAGDLLDGNGQALNLNTWVLNLAAGWSANWIASDLGGWRLDVGYGLSTGGGNDPTPNAVPLPPTVGLLLVPLAIMWLSRRKHV